MALLSLSLSLARDRRRVDDTHTCPRSTQLVHGSAPLPAEMMVGQRRSGGGGQEEKSLQRIFLILQKLQAIEHFVLTRGFGFCWPSVAVGLGF